MHYESSLFLQVNIIQYSSVTEDDDQRPVSLLWSIEFWTRFIITSFQH
jgi:hypothetical protein